jgi:hypothetical protein
MDLGGALLTIVGYAVFHGSCVNSLMLYSGLDMKWWVLAPKSVLLSRSHLLGVAALSIGVAVIIGSATVGLLQYGIWIGGALTLLDPYLTWRAIRHAGGFRNDPEHS